MCYADCRLQGAEKGFCGVSLLVQLSHCESSHFFTNVKEIVLLLLLLLLLLFIIIIIIHSTHHLLFDWLKAYSEFSKSVPRMSSNCRLYNNRVEVTQGHG